MMPVEQIATRSGSSPNRPAALMAVFLVCSSPSCPVQALAFPELMTTAPAWPSVRMRSVQMTGAARKRFGVKTPTAVSMGP